jgi:hypothetical protein
MSTAAIWERIKRIWTSPSPPDHPLTEAERQQLSIRDTHDRLGADAATYLGHGDPDTRGKLD